LLFSESPVLAKQLLLPLPRTASRITANDGISRVPITILFARRVGELMCELSDNATPKASYRFYI
jgi:hypothetical protein